MSKPKINSHVLPYLSKITEWVAKGATGKEIAKKLHISYSSFLLYLSKGEKGIEPYSELFQAYTQACEEPDDEVEASLYKLACGYNANVQKVFKIRRIEYDPHTGRRVSEREELVTREEEVHVAANVMAQQFWLTNRRKTRWEYKPEKAVGEESGAGFRDDPLTASLRETIGAITAGGSAPTDGPSTDPVPGDAGEVSDA